MIAAILTKAGDLMLGEFKTIMVERLSRVETKIDRMEKDVDEMKIEIRDVNGQIMGLNGRTGRLEAATSEIQSTLKSAGAQIHQPMLINSGSPLKLTPAGEEMIRKIDGYEFISAHKNFYFALIEKLNPQNEYDVQEAAKKVLLESVAHPILNPIKKYAYETRLNIETLLAVLGIILRDAFLEKHSTR